VARTSKTTHEKNVRRLRTNDSGLHCPRPLITCERWRRRGTASYLPDCVSVVKCDLFHCCVCGQLPVRARCVRGRGSPNKNAWPIVSVLAPWLGLSRPLHVALPSA
jgi:hypothetical protein